MENTNNANELCNLLVLDCKIIEVSKGAVELSRLIKYEVIDLLITDLIDDLSFMRVLKWLSFVTYDTGTSSLSGVRFKNTDNEFVELDLIGRSVKINEKRCIDITILTRSVSTA
jgi:hypothetical protein